MVLNGPLILHHNNRTARNYQYLTIKFHLFF